MKNIRVIILSIALLISNIYAQEICPIENLSVLGGDGQNILTWDEPANPFLVTFTVAITTDSWPTEISWDLVNNGDGSSVASISPGDLTNAGETYTTELDIEHGNYTFTIYDTFGDGNSGGFILYIDGTAIFTFDGSESYTEYEVVFDTQGRWYGAMMASYQEPFPYEKGAEYDLSILEGLELTNPVKTGTGNFEITRDVPVECGEFVNYRVHRGNGSVIGTTQELEFSHTSLVNGTEYCYYITVEYDTNGTAAGDNAISGPSATVCATPEVWAPAAPSNLMSFPGDEEMLLIWQAPGGGGGGGGTEGDKIENPFVITGLPFYAEGTTEGFEDDYDAVCPYTGSTSADVVYMMTSSGATYDFTLCTNTAYDSKIYILDIDGNVVEGDFIGIDGDNYGLACNDDACSTPSYASPYVSGFSGELPPGLFYVVVDGYGGNNGAYTLDISLAAQQTANHNSNNNQSRTEYDFLGYNVYVDNVLNNTDIVEFSSYTATGIQNEVQYTFGVAAVYEGPAGGDNYESDTITVQDASVFLFGDVTGVIYDPNNAPMDSVVVSASGISDTTGADGAFAIMNLNVGTHIVQASKPGFYTNTAEVSVLAQAEPTVQNITLAPDMPSPVALMASPGDEKVYLSWRSPGSVAFYDIAYYDEVFEGQIGCGAGGCAFGVRFTPANYPATLQGFVLSMQGDAGSTNASVDVYLDPAGAIAGPVGDPITVLASADLSSPDGGFVQYSFDISDQNIEVSSGDIYIVVNDGGGFLGIADDLEPISPEYFDRNWVTTGYAWNTIADEYYGLAGDFGILASFLGAPGQAAYAVTASGQPVEIPQLSYGRLSNFSEQTIVQGNGFESDHILSDLYNVNPVPSLERNSSRDDSLEIYNIYQVADDATTTLVASTTDTLDTITVSANYNNYCYHVKAQWNTGDPSVGGYGVLESRPSNTACAIPYSVGDANFDSETTIADVLALVDFILQETTPSDAAFNNTDVNMDGELNIADVVIIVDIISGTATGRLSSGGSFAHVELSTDHQFSELLVNLDYSGILKGIQFDLKYNPNLVTIGSPALSLMQENVIITYRKISDGHMKVIVADLSGETVESNQQDLVKIPYSFKGEITEVSGISLTDIYVSGPKGKIADVSSRSVSAEVKLVPGVFALHQNYPNPFNPKTEIRFDLPEEAVVDISIYNLMGQKVKTLANREVSPGYHVMQWNGKNDRGEMVSTGMYFYTLNTKKFHAMRKMLFLK